MTDERLKEIKDSIDLQLEYAKHLDIYNDIALEEKELYDYAELLKERISYLERNIVRKEETITELEQERVPYTNEYVNKIKKENEELKKQLEESKLNHKQLKDLETAQLLNSYQVEKLIKLNNQQQEFIKYLENCIKELEKESLNKLQNVLNLGICDITKEILKKNIRR